MPEHACLQLAAEGREGAGGTHRRGPPRIHDRHRTPPGAPLRHRAPAQRRCPRHGAEPTRAERGGLGAHLAQAHAGGNVCVAVRRPPARRWRASGLRRTLGRRAPRKLRARLRVGLRAGLAGVTSGRAWPVPVPVTAPAPVVCGRRRTSAESACTSARDSLTTDWIGPARPARRGADVPAAVAVPRRRMMVTRQCLPLRLLKGDAQQSTINTRRVTHGGPHGCRGSSSAADCSCRGGAILK